ncbi:MAG: aminopeptidase P family protein [Lachnospiraceae bacterium]|nr:aminopeptidase P family protein [Lachnospiraceae bacterium]
MENRIVKERIEKLREKMQEKNLQWYLIPTGDFHNSEYVNDYFKTREYFSGFTGSNGSLLVSAEMCGLWTDGRYFIQAEKELKGTGIILFRMMDEGVPTLLEYLERQMRPGDRIGFDGRVVTASYGEKLAKLVEKSNTELWQNYISYEEDLADAIWHDRPALPCHEVFLLPVDITGETTECKIAKLRSKMQEAGADTHILTRLDDIMWLFNMRGGDITCNPVALSYGVIGMDKVCLFIQQDALGEEVRGQLAAQQIELLEYGDFYGYLKQNISDKRILLDVRNVNFTVRELLRKCNVILERSNPTELWKAIKNTTELANLKGVYITDSVAVTRFIYWVKQIVREKHITEYDAAEYLDNLRRQIPGFLDLSFETISAYMENAAMMHYSASKESARTLRPEGTLLVDSGGQYMGGTTDVTRTICLGDISEKERLHFTYTCIGMLNLLNARFLYGCTGRNLDILAREPLWRIDTDYKCGTGHGIGYILNVHEGPHSIRWRASAQEEETPFEEGMLVSNEPGVYIEDQYGIRIENIMLCRKGNKNGDGQFLYFEPLTYVPIDRDAMDKNYMTHTDIERFNDYHRKVYEIISPYLTEEERVWLKKETRPL